MVQKSRGKYAPREDKKRRVTWAGGNLAKRSKTAR